MDVKHDLLRKPSKLYGGEANCRRCCQTSEYPSLPTTKLDWIWFYECVFFSRGAPSYVGSTEIFMSTISAGRYQHERPQNIVRRVTAQTSNWVRACVIHLHIQTIVLHVSDSLFPACIEAAVFSFYNFFRSFRLLSYIIISLLGFILHCLLILRRRPLLLCTMYSMTKLNGVKCGRM